MPLMMGLRKSGACKEGSGFAFWPMLLEKVRQPAVSLSLDSPE